MRTFSKNQTPAGIFCKARARGYALQHVPDREYAESAAKAGISDVVVVETTGDVLVAVRRRKP
ncbi:MAG: hypothetical protein GX125_05845 [Bacteroidales bacterium]|nr:hypothetical protein [Bacteroidota bacterium]NLN99769.1 hypothetical protein [Bacteroidales bacterium]